MTERAVAELADPEAAQPFGGQSRVDHDRPLVRIRARRPLAQLAVGKARDQLLFGNGSEHVKLPASRNGWFTVAVRAAQEDDPTFPRVTPHDLRHTAASLAVQAGAHVKAVQRMLGRASAAMTLDVYADLFDDDLDAVAAALDQAKRSANVVTVLSRERDRKA